MSTHEHILASRLERGEISHTEYEEIRALLLDGEPEMRPKPKPKRPRAPRTGAIKQANKANRDSGEKDLVIPPSRTKGAPNTAQRATQKTAEAITGHETEYEPRNKGTFYRFLQIAVVAIPLLCMWAYFFGENIHKGLYLAAFGVWMRTVSALNEKS